MAEFIGEAHEQDLLRRVAERDRRAIRELLEAFEPLVAGVARRHAAGVPLNDLLQAGNVALLKAVPGYDPDKGRFASYAKKRVEGAIKREAGRLAAKERTGLTDDIAVLAQDDLSGEEAAVVPLRMRRVVFEESETGQPVARDPYLEHRQTDFIDAYHLLAGWLLEEEHDQEIDWESWDYFVRHESALLRAIEQGDRSALAQLAQKYLGLPRRPGGDSHQAKELRLAPDRRSQVLAAMVAHAVEAGTVAERLARARGRRSGAGPGFWEVRRFRELYLPDGLLAPERVVPWVEVQAAREGRPAAAYLRLPCHDADLTDIITGSQEAYAAWLVCEAERLRSASDVELPVLACRPAPGSGLRLSRAPPACPPARRRRPGRAQGGHDPSAWPFRRLARAGGGRLHLGRGRAPARQVAGAHAPWSLPSRLAHHPRLRPAQHAGRAGGLLRATATALPEGSRSPDGAARPGACSLC